MNGEDILSWTSEARSLMQQRLGVRGRDLAAQVARAGRMLPRAVAREGRYLAQAAQLAQNPKLLRMIDPAKAARAHVILTDHLRGVRPGERRRNRALGILAVVGFNLLIVLLAGLAWLAWRGQP